MIRSSRAVRWELTHGCVVEFFGGSFDRIGKGIARSIQRQAHGSPGGLTGLAKVADFDIRAHLIKTRLAHSTKTSTLLRLGLRSLMARS